MIFRQDLYWDNLPTKKIKSKIKRFQNLKNTFLKDIKDPFFLFTGTGNINFNRFKRDKKLLDKLKKRNTQIFLYEPVSYYLKTEKHYSLGYYSEFHSFHNNSKNIRASELDSIQKFSKNTGIKFTVNTCDYGLKTLLQEFYPELNIVCRDLFLRQAVLAYMPKVDGFRNITKKFWCGNSRYTIHRHIIMCYLVNKSGNYSWRFKGGCDWSDVVDWIENMPMNALSSGAHFLNNKDFYLDFKTDKLTLIEKNGHYQPEGPFSNPNYEYYKTFRETFLAIINETRFAQPTANISEKVIDAMNYRSPFVLVAPPYSLKYLKILGFKTFSGYWDESYDEEENHSERMKKIFKIIDFIDSLSFKELNTMYSSMSSILDHNRNLLKNLQTNSEILNV